MCKSHQPKLFTAGPLAVVLLDEETDHSSTFQILPACLSRTQRPDKQACPSPGYWGEGLYAGAAYPLSKASVGPSVSPFSFDSLPPSLLPPLSAVAKLHQNPICSV